MVRLRTESFKSDNLRFSYTVNIDKEGNFTTTLPEEIVNKLLDVGVELGTNRLHKRGFFSSVSLGGLKIAVEDIANKYSKKELVEEKIILKYAIETKCSYWKGKDGQIYPNGQWDPNRDEETKGRWITGREELHANNRSPFGFEIYVKPQKLTIWKFPDGEIKKEYDRLSDEDYKGDEILHWLDSICSISKDYSSPDKEIDYTLEVGLFFKNTLQYIFNINENMIKTFGEDLDLTKIDLKSIPSLGFSSQSSQNPKEVSKDGLD